MATKKSRASIAQSAVPDSPAPNISVLEKIVEEERSRLVKAHAILNCVVIAMEDDGICAGGGPYYPAVIESARDLVNESINRLDSVGLVLMSGKLQDNEVAETTQETLPRGKYEVREESVKYVC
jgi:hypothetical protein